MSPIAHARELATSLLAQPRHATLLGSPTTCTHGESCIGTTVPAFAFSIRVSSRATIRPQSDVLAWEWIPVVHLMSGLSAHPSLYAAARDALASDAERHACSDDWLPSSAAVDINRARRQSAPPGARNRRRSNRRQPPPPPPISSPPSKRQQRVSPPHLVALPPCIERWHRRLGVCSISSPAVVASTVGVLPKSTARVVAAAEREAVNAFLDLQSTGDGQVAFDKEILETLVRRARNRALARGSNRVTPRDVKEAAQTIAEHRRSGVPLSSPAEELPIHYHELIEKLAAVREGDARSQLPGEAKPRVLVIGETSGVVASMFAEAGIEVCTCDLGPSTRDDIPHFQGDARYIQDLGWDLVIAHPPCTYLSNAGVQWLHTEEGRWDRMHEAVETFRRIRAAKARFVVVEQPKLHRYAREALGGLRATQYVHPWQHGTGHTKPTGLYISGGLPPLEPTCVVPGRIHALAKLPPSPHRGELRSRTYLGVAAAMALQWAPVLREALAADYEPQIPLRAPIAEWINRAANAADAASAATSSTRHVSVIAEGLLYRARTCAYLSRR